MSEVMMTPPSSPRGNSGSFTPVSSPVRRVPFSPSDEGNVMGSPSKRLCVKQPPTPFARRVRASPFGVSTPPPSARLPGVPEGAPAGTPPRGRQIGSGAYSEVDEVDSPLGKAVSKRTPFSRTPGKKMLPRKDAKKEARNYGSPGCVPGACWQEEDDAIDGGYLCALTALAEMLDMMTREKVRRLWSQIEAAIRRAPIAVVRDCKPENMGLVKAGAATPFLKEDGSIGWRRQEEDEVVFTDVGHTVGEGDGRWALLVEDPSEQMLRDFKVEIMRQWMCNPEEDCYERRSRVEAMFRSQ